MPCSRSINVTGTRARASSSATVEPTGPPPAISTRSCRRFTCLTSQPSSPARAGDPVITDDCVVSDRALIAPSADTGLPAFAGNDKYGDGLEEVRHAAATSAGDCQAPFVCALMLPTEAKTRGETDANVADRRACECRLGHACRRS